LALGAHGEEQSGAAASRRDLPASLVVTTVKFTVFLKLEVENLQWQSDVRLILLVLDDSPQLER